MNAGSLKVLLVAAALPWAFPAMAVRQRTVPLLDLVAELRLFMPGEASGGYVVPTLEEEEAFRAAARALLAGDAATAERALRPLAGAFEVLDILDSAGGGRYLGIAEVPGAATGLLPRGWGLFLFAQLPARGRLVIEAPHPLADRESEMDAAVAASRLRPAAFLLAGAHRYADPKPLSDVAHASHLVFQAVHEVALAPDRVAVQIHGFSLATHPGYPDLLLSTGRATPTPDSAAICDRVNQGGVFCVLFDGTAYTDLGAVTNVQGNYAAAALGDGHFLHFELADVARADPARFAVVVDAIGGRFPVAGGCSCGSGSAAPPVLSGLLVLLARRARRPPNRRSTT